MSATLEKNDEPLEVVKSWLHPMACEYYRFYAGDGVDSIRVVVNLPEGGVPLRAQMVFVNEAERKGETTVLDLDVGSQTLSGTADGLMDRTFEYLLLVVVNCDCPLERPLSEDDLKKRRYEYSVSVFAK